MIIAFSRAADKMTDNLQHALTDGNFTVTCELSPPKGADLSALIDKATALKDTVTAFNLTDSAAARMTMDPAAAGYTLIKRGCEVIVQVTSRDKNRLALQSGMLGAHTLGIKNLVIMGGDPPHIGDHPDAKGVNDLFSSQIIQAASALNAGNDHAGNALTGATDFFVGSVCNPGAADLAAELDNTRRKFDAGAKFFQTQAIYDADKFYDFADKLNLSVPLLAGVIPVKSVKMANHMNDKVPGVDIPAAVIKRIADADAAGDVVAESVAVAAETVAELRDHAAGVHIMAIGWEKHIPALLKRAGVAG